MLHQLQVSLKPLGLHTTNDIQLCGCVFGLWIFVFIIYIFVEIQPHLLDNVDRLFEVESNYYIN
jgi:hypothetical protein